MEQVNDRRDIMATALEECMKETFFQSCVQIQTELEENGENLWKEVKTAIYGVLDQVQETRKQGKKGNIKYLAFCFLKAGIYSDRLEWYIEAFDDGFYLDSQETGGYYCPAFLNDRYVEDLNCLYKSLSREFVRIQNYEWDRIKESYAAYYNAFMFQMTESLKEMMIEEIAKSDIALADGFKIIYGGYMDKAEVIYEV